MGSPVPLRSDYDSATLIRLARLSRDSDQARRLLALASIYDGGRRSDAARLGNVTLQIIRDWVLRFNHHGPDGLISGKAPGATSKLNATQRLALAAMVDKGPILAVHGVVRWRRIDLAQWIWEEFRISISPQTMSRELRALNYRKLSARPRHHAQADGAIEDFKKVFRPVWRRLRETKRSTAPISKSGSPTKPGSARRTRSVAAGPNAEAAL